MFRLLVKNPKKWEMFDKSDAPANTRSERYKILFPVGEGGEGIVFVAEDTLTREPVAIKQYRFDSRRKVRTDEVKIMKRMRPKSVVYGDDLISKYVIEFKESFLVESSVKSAVELWIVQEFCECGDLFNVMKRLRRPFTFIEIKHILSNVLLGLKFLHSRKIVHRDLKCLNILLTRTGRVKICDFGHAERVNYDEEHEIIDSRATDCWMAPEMFKDGAYYGYEVDIWALGICLIEMTQMQPPFNDQNGDMVASKVLNLPELRLEQQRELLGIAKPPRELTERCESKNNNYWNFYTEEFKFNTIDSDNDVDNEDIKTKHMYIHDEQHSEFDFNSDDEFDVDDDIFGDDRETYSVFSHKTEPMTKPRNKKQRTLKSAIKKRQMKKKGKRGSTDRKGTRHIKKKSIFASGPLNINVTRKRRKSKNPARKKRKKQSLVTELFNIRNSILRKSKKRNKEGEATLRRRIRALKKKRASTNSDTEDSYSELMKESNEVILNEFIAWCLSTEQSRRPNIFDLIRHPFISNEVKDLTKCDKTECSINDHSDFLLRSNILYSNDIRNEEMEEVESDDDCFLTEEEQQNEVYKELKGVTVFKEVCTCSQSQILIRESVCDEFAQLMKDADNRKSRMIG